VTFPSRRRTAAFTLIELLVVVGIIALLAGIIGVAFGGGGNSATAIQSAQSTLSGLLASARGQAALTGYNAALFVNNTPGTSPTWNSRYLRYCVVAVYQPVTAGSTTYDWVAVNDGVSLPNGAYVVPPDVSSRVATDVSFSGINVNGFDGVKNSVKLNLSSAEDWLVLGVSPLGGRVDATSVTSSSSPAATATGYIVISSADPQPPSAKSPILFNNAQNVRGMSISQYGVAGFINDATGFQ
jgi:prepilin-type N-terminal cleavage/methylation domain-containing protein